MGTFKIDEKLAKNILLLVGIEPISPSFLGPCLNHLDEDNAISLAAFVSILDSHVPKCDRV